MDPSGKAFAVMAANYKARYPSDDPAETAFVANAYDAFYVAAFATLALPSGKRDGQSIVANLARLSDHKSTSVVVGPNAINSGVTPLQMGGVGRSRRHLGPDRLRRRDRRRPVGADREVERRHHRRDAHVPHRRHRRSVTTVSSVTAAASPAW